ncbi:serine/threonine-protein kinase [Streptomyces malaysiensis]|uniref:serine/threonine-protein kinase n=1 Tax=Streptomyces malaysiensis TaxID=92644 RepID=UPI0033E40057
MGGDLSGRLLGGRYRVTGRLGRGGMGVVCKAVDAVLGREVAVKVLRAHTDASSAELADLRTRMQREARAAARIRHPGVITVHDVSEESGLPLIVMELIDGPSLDDVIDERGTIDPREAAGIGAEIADALGAAHGAGVLHRDVKPGNVLLDREGRVILTDFGIASLEAPEDGATTKLTRSGELIGSLDYLAPERAQGQDPSPASDIWALGMTLYAAVEGSSPFRRTSVWSTLTAIVTEPLPEPRLAGPLAPVLYALMDKDPRGRPSAAEARRMLAEVAAGETPRAVAPPPVPPPVPPTAGSAAAPPPPGFGPPPEVEPLVSGEPGAGDRADPRAAGRGRRGALIAAAVAAVVLIGGGVTYALVGGDDHTTASDGTKEPRRGAGPGETVSPGGGGASGTPGRGSARPGDRASPPASRAPDGGDQGGPASARPSGAAPVCHDSGGGRYDCEVWRDATSYTHGGEPVGTLEHGVNYLYCQENLGRRETYGKWTNVWWARTDDDNGHRDVYVSVVYVKGGDNDAPLPGLPEC